MPRLSGNLAARRRWCDRDDCLLSHVSDDDVIPVVPFLMPQHEKVTGHRIFRILLLQILRGCRGLPWYRFGEGHVINVGVWCWARMAGASATTTAAATTTTARKGVM